MAKQSFSVGQVLTANQMLSLQQTAMLGGSATAKTASYTLVAADAGTVVSVNSTSATTITVNTGLFSAGDTVTIQNWGSGLVTITAGTATVNTAGSLIVPQYDGGVLYFTSASAAIYFDFVQAGAVSPLTTKGDLYTFGSSDTRLGVGANGTTLVADSAEATGLKWAAAASGGMTLLSTTTLSGASTTISSISQDYNNLQIIIKGVTGSSENNKIRLAINNVADAWEMLGLLNASSNWDATINLTGAQDTVYTNANNSFSLLIFDYANTARYKPMALVGTYFGAVNSQLPIQGGGYFGSNTAVSSLVFTMPGNTFSTGTVLVYGVK